uniref:Uncharacterized protein n=1 Tax=Chlamydomonas leiostraca TaxID=1034604 RepID=A0A7S0X0N3_9CHLO
MRSAVSSVRVLAIDVLPGKALLEALPALLSAGWLPNLREVHASCTGMMRVDTEDRGLVGMIVGADFSPLFVALAQAAPKATVRLYVDAGGEARLRQLLALARPELQDPDQLQLVHV